MIIFLKKTFRKILAAVFSLTLINHCYTQNFPTFSSEFNVTISGLTFDAMEPFITPDGSKLFFNSLNDGVNTSLYYASRINDTLFQFEGEVSGTNLPPPHLDAVASLDSAEKFYWITTRDYPAVYENILTGSYANGNVTDMKRVYSNFYISLPGWLIMDACIDYSGINLFYCNAFFNNCQLPCYSQLGMAFRVNDTVFQKSGLSDFFLSNITDTNYLIYAPNPSSDLLELYFTRILRGTFETQICVSVRNTVAEPFSQPQVIVSHPTMFPEAATITFDKSKLYYHKKSGSLYSLFMRYRNFSSVDDNPLCDFSPLFFPNPATTDIIFNENTVFPIDITVYNVCGEIILNRRKSFAKTVDLTRVPRGVYYVKAEGGANCKFNKLIKL